jgi:hypothetical protein
MDVVIRLLLRFILVPLGAVIAVAVAAVFVIVGHWNAVMTALSTDPQAQGYYLLAFLFASPVLLLVLSIWALFMFVPAAIGVLVAETFAIRSWVFHVINGGVSAAIGWALMRDMQDDYRFLAEPKVLIASGLASGLTYWLIAGWTAGFWKPVRVPRPPAALPPPV